MSASSFPSLSELSLTIVIVWPNTLVTCAMFNTLHSQNYAGIGRRDGISRERFFAYAFLAAALWCTYYSSFFIAIPLSSPPLPHICHPCLLTSPRQPKLWLTYYGRCRTRVPIPGSEVNFLSQTKMIRVPWHHTICPLLACSLGYDLTTGSSQRYIIHWYFLGMLAGTE